MSDKKRRLQEENDVLLEIGKEGKDGIKAFKEYAKEDKKKNQKHRDELLERIDSEPKKRLSYNLFLSKLLARGLRTVEWQPRWRFNVAPTQRGVVMEMKSPDGRTFRSAFKSTGDSVTDLNAIEMFVLRAENTVDKETKIWLPNKTKTSL